MDENRDVLLEIASDTEQSMERERVENDTFTDDEFDSAKNYLARDRLYTSLLSKYIEQNESKTNDNRCLKKCFFLAIIVTMGIIVSGTAVVFIIMAAKGTESVVSGILAVGGTGSLVSAIIVLPRIIAEYLFPKNEEQHMLDIVQRMQSNDTKMREAHDRRRDFKGSSKRIRHGMRTKNPDEGKETE